MYFYPIPLGLDSTAVDGADWVEIQLAAQAVPRVSIDDLTDYLQEDPAEQSSDEVESGDESKWSLARDLAEDAFSEIRLRANWLGTRYPLEFENDEVTAWVASSPASAIYEFLVLLRARQIRGESMDGGTPNPGSLFEELMTEAAKAYAGPRGVRFGVAGGVRGGGLPLDLTEAVRDLAKRMSEKPADSPGSGTGDYKADAIAWRPFGDNLAGQLVLIAQATITERDWHMKEIPKRWKDGRVIQFVANPLPAVGFVETMSLYSRDFFRGAGFRSVPFDRLRILSLLNDESLATTLVEGMQRWTKWAITRLTE